MNMLLSLLAVASVLESAPERVLPQAPPKQAPAGQTPAQARAPRPLPLPKGIIQARGKTEITIDGALGDWPKAAPMTLRDPRQVSGTALGAYRGPNDISGQVFMVWDNQFLYVAIQVLDEWHRALGKKTKTRLEIPSVDNVEITFDPNRDTTGIGPDPGREEDRTFYFAQIQEIGRGLLIWDRVRGKKSLVPDGVSACDRQERAGLTIYEARIPWREILPPGQQPAPQRVMDLQIVLNDYDAFTDPIPQTRVGWNFGMGVEIQPGLFGSVMLVEDFDAEKDRFPVFPPPAKSTAKRKSTREWVDFYASLADTEPKFCTAETVDPGMVGGKRRFDLLNTLDGHLEAFPRIDNLEFHYRIQRRMYREINGLIQSGLPFYWDYAMRDVRRRAVAAPPAGTIRVFRLPQGGWYIRSDTTNFTIDACGQGVEKLFLQRGIDFAIMTRPSELTLRHDQLMIRMATAKPKRRFFTHLDIHLPGAKPGSIELVKPMEDIPMGGLRRIVPIGMTRDDGKVTVSMGYLIEWEDGRSLVHAGLALTQKEVRRLRVDPDVLLLSGFYGGEQAAVLAREFNARYTILDDVLAAETYPDPLGGRITYRQALALQSDLKPRKSLILAPGESIDIQGRDR